MTDVAHIGFSGVLALLPQDLDPAETKEWLQAFDAVVELEGRERATDPETSRFPSQTSGKFGRLFRSRRIIVFSH